MKEEKLPEWGDKEAKLREYVVKSFHENDRAKIRSR